MASAVGGRDGSRPERLRPTPEVLINRLVLWNIDLTLMDVGRITREAYAEAFRRSTGRPLRQLPQLPGRMESEIFFEALALNEAVQSSRHAEQQMTAQVQGKADMVDVVTAVSETEVAVETMVAVRNKVIEAYQSIMSMPI